MENEIKKLEALVKDAIQRGSYRVNLLQTYLRNAKQKMEKNNANNNNRT